MNIVKAAGIALVVLGVLGLAFGSFSYKKDMHAANVGSFQITASHRETVDVSVWASVGAIVVGVALLLKRG